MGWSSVHRVISAVAACLVVGGVAAAPATAAVVAPPTTPTSPSSTPLGPTITTPGAPPIPADVLAGAFVLAEAGSGAVLAERAPHQ
jgi:hypothetical protein